ncbi:Putative glycine cleavage T-protein/YgfZ [Septoria linicola]|uniref:Aminomethyltransferase n=1 Tax=Septoria linicola TaxID=215465 RepID=A0A9Q9AC71_9PEZI|nr:putative glycine cleavage T-protein/YgfZ [Septoria linicola]USW46849.1 Putative glycine cleavage T-protein/YgfZ [Septoria linicola]
MAASRTVSRAVLPVCNAFNLSQNAGRAVAVVALSTRSISTRIARPQNTGAKTKTFFNGSLAQQRRAESSNATPAPEMHTEANPGRTALYDLHLEHGGKMVPFGGYSMPVQYSDLSVGESHAWTREKASLFDVGHMVQYHVEGPGAEAFLESITPSGVKELKVGQSTLSALLLPKTGGIGDDCIITRLEAGPKHLFYLVTNAGCREKDYKYLSSAIANWDNTVNPVVSLRHLQAEDAKPYGLIALQGPLSAEILQAAFSPNCKVDLSKWYFGNLKYITLSLLNSSAGSGESLPIVASRGGYTGEDGFELSIHPSQTVEVTKALLEIGTPERLRFAGLGARDSLRLEAGMCLYGHDLDDTTTPVEAGLSWIIPKSRRSGDRANFNGAETIVPQITPKKEGGVAVTRRRVGFVVEGAPAREGAEVLDKNGQVIGRITSGCPSPTMKKNIAMGYIKDGQHKAGTEVQVKVRGKARKAVVSKMPFVPAKYVKEALSPA